MVAYSTDFWHLDGNPTRGRSDAFGGGFIKAIKLLLMVTLTLLRILQKQIR